MVLDRFRNISLGARFAMMVTAILVVTLGVATFFSAQAERSLLLDNLDAKGRALGNFVALISPSAILSYDFEGMTDLVREVTREEDIVFAVLIAKNGISLTNYLDYDNLIVAGVSANIPKDDVLGIIDMVSTRAEIVNMSFPVRFQGEDVATLSLGLSRARIDQQFSSTLLRLAATNLAIIIFLSACIYLAFRFLVMRRIDRLNLGLQHVAAGDLDYRVEIDSTDEIGSLQRSFTDMEGRLKQTIEEKDNYSGRLQQQAEEMRRLRDDAIRANKHKSEFLANMSHELRTPLNAIIGFSEVLKEKMFGELNEKQAEYTEDIHSSGRHLLSLINDILDLSKIEAGHMELNIASFDLSTAIGDALTLIRERASRHLITVESHIDEQFGEFVADERKFKQILLNLLSNATKFTPDGGMVSIWAIRDGDSIRVSVKDTGIGISSEDQEKIFDEFQQVGSPEERAQVGTGLGLALTQTFVEMHGGSISVESELGKGSTFTFNLPFKACPEN